MIISVVSSLIKDLISREDEILLNFPDDPLWKDDPLRSMPL